MITTANHRHLAKRYLSEQIWKHPEEAHLSTSRLDPLVDLGMVERKQFDGNWKYRLKK